MTVSNCLCANIGPRLLILVLLLPYQEVCPPIHRICVGEAQYSEVSQNGRDVLAEVALMNKWLGGPHEYIYVLVCVARRDS